MKSMCLTEGIRLLCIYGHCLQTVELVVGRVASGTSIWSAVRCEYLWLGVDDSYPLFLPPLVPASGVLVETFAMASQDFLGKPIGSICKKWSKHPTYILVSDADHLGVGWNRCRTFSERNLPIGLSFCLLQKQKQHHGWEYSCVELLLIITLCMNTNS